MLRCNGATGMLFATSPIVCPFNSACLLPIAGLDCGSPTDLASSKVRPAAFDGRNMVDLHPGVKHGPALFVDRAGKHLLNNQNPLIPYYSTKGS